MTQSAAGTAAARRGKASDQPRSLKTEAKHGLPSLALLTDGTDVVVPTDLLEHQTVARSLASAIRGTPATEPLGIGLFGGWGQGKSTIGRLLRAELKEEICAGSVVFVKIDAWKYAYEDTRLPLRRHFLLQAYEEAGFHAVARRLREGSRLEQTRRRIDEGAMARAQAALSATTRWSALRGITVALLIIAVAFFGGFGTLKSLVFTLFSVGAAGAVGLFTTVFPTIRDGLLVTTREDPSWSIDIFDDHLQWLLNATDGATDTRPPDAKSVERFVFFIDDLDRCNDKIVVEAISTLQAFFGKGRCVYIVAADDRQLKRAIRGYAGKPQGDPNGGPIPADESFLEKIFQVAVYVPRPSSSARRRYAKEVAASTRLASLGDDERESLLTYLVHPRVASPRQVRVIINDFLLTWRLAEERESEPRAHLRKGDLTDSKLLLAKLVVLRAHFPWFFELLYETPGLLSVWQRFALAGEPEDNEDGALAGRVVRDAAMRASAEIAAFEGDDGKAAGMTSIERLVTDLHAFLSLTRRTLPKDASQVQEFIYLRSREEFQSLTGAAGEAFRLAIDTGDERAIAAAVQRDASQRIPATKAALALARDGDPVQRDAGRRALLALIKGMPFKDVREVGKNAAAVLYEDETEAAERLHEHDAAAHARLIRWMPAGVLRHHVGDTPLDSVSAFVALGMALQERAPQAWTEVVVRAVSGPEQVAGMALQACRRLRPTFAQRLLAPTLRAIRPDLESPSTRITDVGGTVSDVSDNWLTIAKPDGTSLEAYFPEGVPPAATSGSPVTVSGHIDSDGDLVVDKMRIADEVALEHGELRVVPLEVRDAGWAIFDALIRQSERVPGVRVASEIAELPGIDWQTAVEAGRAAIVARRVISSSGAGAAHPLVRAISTSESVRTFAEPAAAFAEAMLSVSPDELPKTVDEAVKLAAHAVTEGLAANAAASLRNCLAAAGAAMTADEADAAAAIVALPAEDLEAGPLLMTIVAPLSPAVAASHARIRIEERLPSLSDLADLEEDALAEALEPALRAVHLLESLAATYGADVREEVKKLPLAPAVGPYALKVMTLRDTVGALGLKVPAQFLASAAGHSGTGALLAQKHALRRPQIGVRELQAVLSGAPAYPTGEGLDALRALMSRRTAVMSAIDQAVFLVSRGRRTAAERAYGPELASDIFDAGASALHASPTEAARLFGALESSRWPGRTKNERKEFADRFANLLGTVRTSSQLATVVQAMLDFFGSAERVESVRAIKSALERAVRRVRRLTTTDAEVVLRAADGLRVQKSRERWFSELVRRHTAS